MTVLTNYIEGCMTVLPVCVMTDLLYINVIFYFMADHCLSI